ncbi:tRNA (uracil-5-)-methyltransferase [Blautia producta]|uniref:tRNA (Uracil-5-)-methyltransferase n=1 Tax=Blautia producta TaxID=33035 RepID=A0A4P6LWA9_9FIRM|nr:tRNA (uracil-5-)-methyltransferase [Blautia producta]QBE96369.1 hypothetical protein PMF13cell1_01913 [Blautia producta]
MKKRTLWTAAVVILLIAAVGAGIAVGMNWNSHQDREKSVSAVDSTAEEWTGKKETYTGEKNTDTIDIPGFDTMNLKAGSTGQSVNLFNPEQNNCYFKMSILLSDGTVLWESDLVEPGRAIYEMTMDQALEAGEYQDAVLKYECFAMDPEQSPLNGSEVKLTLNVIE